MKLKNKVNSWLPFFNGFYETLWEYDNTDNLIYDINEIRQEKKLNEIDFDVLDIDYKQYEIDIVEEITKEVQNHLSDYVESIQFEEIISPKYYNFSNDSVNVEIVPKIDNIRQFIYQNIDLFKEYLKNTYTSYDGFISHYSNDFAEWQNMTQDFTNFENDRHLLGSVLQFIWDNVYNSDNELDIYYHVSEKICEYEYIKNWDEVTSKYSCSKCNSLINNNDTEIKLKKYHNIMGRYPKNCLCDECI